MYTKKDQTAVLLGEAIRHHRRAIGMTQEQLTECLDVNKNYVGLVERGESFPSIPKLCQIAKALKIKVVELVDELD